MIQSRWAKRIFKKKKKDRQRCFWNEEIREVVQRRQMDEQMARNSLESDSEEGTMNI